MRYLPLSEQASRVHALEARRQLHLGCCHSRECASMPSLPRAQAGDSIMEEAILVLPNESQLLRCAVLRQGQIVCLVCLSPDDVAPPPELIVPLLLSLLAHFQVALSQLFCPLVLLDLESGLVDVLSALEVALHRSSVGLDVVQLVVQLLLSIQEHLLLHLEVLEM